MLDAPVADEFTICAFPKYFITLAPLAFASKDWLTFIEALLAPLTFILQLSIKKSNALIVLAPLT